eukprot:9371429-Pyramimonas_sp.AAC.1
MSALLIHSGPITAPGSVWQMSLISTMFICLVSHGRSASAISFERPARSSSLACLTSPLNMGRRHLSGHTSAPPRVFLP